jgi:RNA polymerase sigma factor (sigma-70 family)
MPTGNLQRRAGVGRWGAKEPHGEPTTEDSKLVERARDGDTDAFEDLVTRYRDLAFRAAWLITRSTADAEDATQEAFVKAYYALPRFRREAPFRPWLLRIVTNEARNRGRSARRREALGLRVAAEPSHQGPSPETEVLAREDREELVAALERLREPDRLVIAYRYFFDLSEAEMADVLAVRPGTVKSRLARAMGRLRAELGAEGEAT